MSSSLAMRDHAETSGALPIGVTIGPCGVRYGLTRAHLFALTVALLVALLLRAPGILWGYNFPTGWYGHHPDEYTHLVNTELLISPGAQPRWEPHSYPKAMAAHVAAPVIVLRNAEVRLFNDPPTPGQIITTGRAVNAVYGAMTVLLAFMLARHLLRDARIGVFASCILAFGGLHVSQSHFFVSDVASIFWYLLATYLMLRDLAATDKSSSMYLPAASACLGVSVGLKFAVFTLPPLIFLALASPPRLRRGLESAAFFISGLVLASGVSDTSRDILRAVLGGTNSDTQYEWQSSLLLYLAELPTVVGFPVVILACAGSYFLIRRCAIHASRERLIATLVVIGLPLLAHGWFLLFKLDQFPRHLVIWVPWISILAALGLVRIVDLARSKGVHASLVLVPLFVYLALFVYDGERVFIQEPRNQAAHWLLANVPRGSEVWWPRKNWLPGYSLVQFPDRGRPPVLILEMHEVNPFLSGQGLKDSYPADYKKVFNASSESSLLAMQQLFRGESEYREVARFGEGYFMPEFRLVDGLIGNRARNYVAEIVVFMRDIDMLDGQVHGNPNEAPGGPPA